MDDIKECDLVLPYVGEEVSCYLFMIGNRLREHLVYEKKLDKEGEKIMKKRCKKYPGCRLLKYTIPRGMLRSPSELFKLKED